MMIVAFRVDASQEIGTGHVMRCLTLADALQARGAECHFLCREHPGHLMPLIRERGHITHPLPLPTQNPKTESNTHSHWLGTTQSQDALQSATLLEVLAPHWLVVDHYALDARWERQASPRGSQLMVIDDLADRPHECHILLDQNWHQGDILSRYQKLTSAHCKHFLGPTYALLCPEYKRLRDSLPPKDGVIHRIAVFLGGSDSSNQTARVLEALSAPSLQHIMVEVVTGPNHPVPQDIARQVRNRGKAQHHHNLPSLASLMARADLMIGAGGATNWERMCLGLPAIVIGVAHNQSAINQALMDSGYIRYLGDMEKVTVEDIAKAVQNSLDHPRALQKQSRLCQQLVPGTGTLEICDRLFQQKGVDHAT